MSRTCRILGCDRPAEWRAVIPRVGSDTLIEEIELCAYHRRRLSVHAGPTVKFIRMRERDA